MTEKEYQKYLKKLMNKPGAKELETILAPKTIYGMFKWVKEHADYLVWFENYSEQAISNILEHYTKIVGILAVSTHPNAHKDCLSVSIATVMELEMCK